MVNTTYSMLSTNENAILESLPREVIEKLSSQMEIAYLEPGKVLYEAGEIIKSIYFPTAGIISLVTVTEDGCCSEIAMTGKDGLVGYPVLLGNLQNPLQTIVRVEGTAYRIPVDFFIREVNNHEVFREKTLKYIHQLITQMSENSACNQHHRVDENLARWILNNVDILGNDEMTITQEGIATMLGVRREAISEAIGKLNRAGVIRHGRGWIRLHDRNGLEKRACGCYKNGHSNGNGYHVNQSGYGAHAQNQVNPYSKINNFTQSASHTRKSVLAMSHLEEEKNQYFHDIYEFSPVPQLVVDTKLRIKELNLSAAILLDQKRSDLNGKSFVHFLLQADHYPFMIYTQEVLNGKGQQGLVVQLAATPRQKSKKVRIEAVTDEDGEECRLAIVGIHGE